MAKLKTLKACPFCGGKPKRAAHKYSGRYLGMDEHGRAVYEDLRWYAVKCTQCGISQPIRTYNSREESDAAWEARVA